MNTSQLLDPPRRQPAVRPPRRGADEAAPPIGAVSIPPVGPSGAGAQRSPTARLTRAASAFLRRHASTVPIVLVLLAGVAVVLGSGITHYPGFSDDEGTYTAQAWAVLTQGTLAHYTYWYDHPPLGWLQLALLIRLAGPLLPGPGAVAAARGLMLLPALASAALLYVLARRLSLRPVFAGAAVLLFALSPLAVTLLRQVYLDNLATPWLLGAFVLAASPSRRLWAYAASGACFAVAMLTKETSLLALPGLGLLVLQRVDRRTRSFCLAAFGLSCGLIALGYPLYALLKDELLPGRGHVSLLEALTFQLYRRPGTGSPLVSSSAAHHLIAGWLHTDPWLLALGVGLIPCALAVRRLRPVGVVLAVFAVLPLHGGYLPQPYVIGLLPFCALAIAGVLDASWNESTRSSGRTQLRRAAVVAVAVGLLVIVGPRWQRGDAYAMGADQTRPEHAAERWIAAHVDRRARLLVDDTLYVDLVRMGFAQRFGVVWFYKMDFTNNLDPSIVRHLPGGWRSFDYVVSTPVIRSALEQSPGGLEQVRLLLQNSRPVATFGAGSERVEVRRAVGVGVGSGLIPRAGGRPHPKPSRRAARSGRTAPGSIHERAPRSRIRTQHS
ncbi:MAG: ArnT family glycosyltransferase [Solirubrobacteraceae bacterium]